MVVEIVNWERYNPRRDIRNPWWFACSNRLFDDADFADFESDEILFWVYCLSQASIKGSRSVELKPAHYKKWFSDTTVKSAISKLLSCTALKVTDVRLPGGVPVPTEQYKTEQNKRRESISATALPRVAIIWNECVKSLPKVKTWTKSRERAVKNLEVDEAKAIFEKVEASNFLSGRSGRWAACSFDWVLKPANLVKISEGNYDNRDEPKLLSPPIDTWHEKAEKVRTALAKSGHWAGRDHAEIEQLLGTELMQIAIKAGTNKLRSLPEGPFVIKQMAGMLRAAAEGP